MRASDIGTPSAGNADFVVIQTHLSLCFCGGPKGDGLKEEIEAGKYPGIVKTTLDGFDQRDYLEGKSDKSARDVFFIFLGSDAVRGTLQELEDITTCRSLGRMAGSCRSSRSTSPWSGT
jgi:hypothetical protein